MAQHQFDIVNGQHKEALSRSAGSSIGTSAVRVTIDDGNCPSKAAALLLLKEITNKLIESPWPLA